MNILIVKHGALGDIVRTSYFAKSIKFKFPDCKIYWLTAQSGVDLVAGNPYIDYVSTDPSSIFVLHFDLIYSLDDESEVLEKVSKFSAKKLIGAYLDKNLRKYTKDSSEWFDMGLLSDYGKEMADSLKRSNTKSHLDIFSSIFDVKNTSPEFYYPSYYENKFDSIIDSSPFNIGINPYAGGRWPSKELLDSEFLKLVTLLLNYNHSCPIKIYLLGSGSDRLRNIELQGNFDSDTVVVPDTNNSILDFATVISKMNFLISSDSLALHLAISQNIPTLAFFTATSAAEIDAKSPLIKIVSSSDDYCSYSPKADNSTITASSLFESIIDFLPK